MHDSYCGKSCEACETKEQLNCSGCKKGPGQKNDGDCTIAACCRTEGCNSCENCTRVANCELFQIRDNIPNRRLQSKDSDDEYIDASTLRKYKNLAELINIIFITSVISFVITLISSFIGENNILLQGIFSLCSGISSIIYIVAICKMGKYNSCFKEIFILWLISIALSIIFLLLSDITVILSTITALALLILMFICLKKEFEGYAELTAGLSKNLSRNWETLGKRFSLFISLLIIGLIVSLVLIFLIPIFGIISAIFFVIMAILCIVLMIAKLIYMKKTADLFKRYYQHYRSM